jgi:hypothetical protein
MKGLLRRLCPGILLSAALAQSGFAQTALTWQGIRDKFEAANQLNLAVGREVLQ